MKPMDTKSLCMTALLGGILFLSFSLCSSILYLEVITLTLVVVSMYFRKDIVLLSIVVFSICLVTNIGFSIYTCMYLAVYVLYGIFTLKLKPYLMNHPNILYLYIGFLSFMTGQILELPFLLVSKKVTIIYILLGLKTSLIQGGISFIAAMLLYDKIYGSLNRILRGTYQ